MDSLWMERYAAHNAHESFEQSLRIIAESCRAKTFADIKVIVNMLAGVLDIQSAAVLIIERDAETRPILVDVLRCDAPNKWLDYYINRNLVRYDPIVESALESNRAFVWNGNLLKTLPSERYKRFPQWAERFGVSGGLIYPFPSQADTAQEFVLYTQACGDKVSALANNLRQISMLLRYPSDAIRRVYKDSRPTPSEKGHSLTKRELQVLSWAIQGKTSSEIAMILSISERTVKFHLSNTYEKLDVINRQQAVAKAIHHRLLETEGLG